MTAVILQFPFLGVPTTDGGKARIKARRQRRMLAEARDILARAEDLSMDHVDPAYTAPDSDPA